ncbi:hypothetical protein H7J77_11690 [Mycolicibacillus parakoreensis]|uniref:Uncharacterized protein n=1 Tax=Mycolicibacillus parakoreensis TaxID=1069221 RepID=A0ABY3UBH1_9MYCO|nr:hypothetical protein [Mycolicibacillus parakoreensis]MCV7316199.1 hypothetical protein [Mycolicibacillus parakoreensis]ULN54791.1 hypothetical protein MIU77_18860 [Mycolicibacillus parakoreensis]
MTVQMRATDAELIEHLADGRHLFVPGGQPHGHDRPALFKPFDDFEASPHPLNSAQTAVVRGSIPTFAPKPGWWVALAHLAHGRGTCTRCERVWSWSAEQWADVPDDGALFAAIDVVPQQPWAEPDALLVHIDDLPADLLQ